MSMRTIWLSLAVSMCFVSSASYAQHRKRLVWRGCGVSKIAFMGACADAYEAETKIHVSLSGGGAKLGIEAAAGGGADLGGTCRPCLAHLGEHKLELQLAVVAWDALVAVVHKENPVDNLTQQQLRDILQQKITNWKTLGGNDERIVVVARAGKSSGVGFSTRQLIFGNVNADYGRGVVRLNSSGPVEHLVGRQRRAIAVTGVSSARKRNLKILSIDGQKATSENIAKGGYPYYRPLYIAFKSTNERAKHFVEWLLSESGQKIVEGEGTVSLRHGGTLADKYKHFENPDQIINFHKLSQKTTSAEDK